jgi:hypothetical protein
VPAEQSNQTLLELKLLLQRAQEFPGLYYAAEQAFRQGNAIWSVISGTALDYLEDRFDLDRERLSGVEQSFVTDWQRSPKYRELEAGLAGLVEESRALLSKCFKRSPSLRLVYQASRLTTKATRLLGVLIVAASEVQSWINSGKQLPVGRSSRRTRRPSKPNPGWLWLLPDTWWEWLGIVVAVVALVVYLPKLLGGSGTGAILVTLGIIVLLIITDRSVRVTRRRARRRKS